MMTMNILQQKLQKADRKHAALYLFCNFISLMIISSYSVMIMSPTILNVFPKGGDTRKQMIAIFIMTLVGCVVFTIYSACLFFRKKSRQLGILMALGASRKCLAPGFFKEILKLSCVSSLVGILAGFPFVWILWNTFSLIISSSTEMKLIFNLRSLSISFSFFILVVLFSCITAFRYLRKTNIIDVLHEDHKNEPVHELGKWCGPVGIILVVFGAILGYRTPNIYITTFSAYPPAWLSIFYTPVFVGLYMIMLHTVVHGYGNNNKKPYKNIISRSMMKFQGKQTVNNLLVITILIAGACFAAFYVPMMAGGKIIDTKSRVYDYFFHYPSDVSIPDKNYIENHAKNYELKLKDWKNYSYITLALDGNLQIVEEDSGSFHYEYVALLHEGTFLSEETYKEITKQDIDVKPGTYCAVTNQTETSTYYLNLEATKLTNMTSRKQLSTKFAGFLHFDMLRANVGYYVLDNDDYNQISKALNNEWKGNMIWFNVAGKDNYNFANELFHTIVKSFEKESSYSGFYDRVGKIAAEEQDKPYMDYNVENLKLLFSNPDSSEFRTYWDYMPRFRILDINDFATTYSVFLMMFIFISIVCILSALIISYTRCQTIAINNRYVFDDLKYLGASSAFLTKEIKAQCSKMFVIPALVGITSMYFLYSLLMFGNDSKITLNEITGLLICLVPLSLIGILEYFVYKKTIAIIKCQLDIK